MSGVCREVRDRLLSGAAAPGAGVAGHLGSCAACARFADRLGRARAALRSRHAGHEPDAGFPARVTASLAAEPAQQFGRLALRLLPATLALAAVLAWWAAGASPTPSPGASAVDRSEDLLGWIVGAEEVDG